MTKQVQQIMSQPTTVILPDIIAEIMEAIVASEKAAQEALAYATTAKELLAQLSAAHPKEAKAKETKETKIKETKETKAKEAKETKPVKSDKLSNEDIDKMNKVAIIERLKSKHNATVSAKTLASDLKDQLKKLEGAKTAPTKGKKEEKKKEEKKEEKKEKKTEKVKETKGKSKKATQIESKLYPEKGYGIIEGKFDFVTSLDDSIVVAMLDGKKDPVVLSKAAEKELETEKIPYKKHTVAQLKKLLIPRTVEEIEEESGDTVEESGTTDTEGTEGTGTSGTEGTTGSGEKSTVSTEESDDTVEEEEFADEASEGKEEKKKDVEKETKADAKASTDDEKKSERYDKMVKVAKESRKEETKKPANPGGRALLERRSGK